MATEEGGNGAIEKLNDFVFDGRNLRVNEAKKREQRGPREY
jgi:RNA recognition motif-containing protein